MRFPDDASQGFTMVEIAVTILIVGMLFALSVPTIQTVSGSYTLKSNTEAIAAQLRLAREKAIATGMDQPMHFTLDYPSAPYDYHIHYAGGHIPAKWALSNGITYLWTAGTISSVTMTRDGRATASGMIILQDTRNRRDTVSVQLSGLVLTK
jgi:prepilin-type N-terminal cleavage/methylation domain-containing protein